MFDQGEMVIHTWPCCNEGMTEKEYSHLLGLAKRQKGEASQKVLAMHSGCGKQVFCIVEGTLLRVESVDELKKLKR